MTSRSLSVSSLLSSLLFLLTAPTFGDEHFDFNRNDSRIPSQCQEFDLSDFEDTQSFFTYGVKGSTSRGFDYEVDISREEASQLWDIFKKGENHDSDIRAKLSNDPHLLQLFDRIQSAEDMGFDFQKEGDILEVLSLLDLSSRYQDSKYFFTGGLEYRDSEHTRTLGELDLLVVERSSCHVVAIGESKLGVKQLSHAHEQLERVHGFLSDRLCQKSNSSSGSPHAPICSL